MTLIANLFIAKFISYAWLIRLSACEQWVRRVSASDYYWSSSLLNYALSWNQQQPTIIFSTAELFIVLIIVKIGFIV